MSSGQINIIEEISTEVEISVGVFQNLLHEDLNVCQHLVPEMLTSCCKEKGMALAGDYNHHG
jgi:hypothetical protein